jgi:cytochrome c oxidase subunit 1
MTLHKMPLFVWSELVTVPPAAGAAGACRRHHHAAHRPQFRHYFFRRMAAAIRRCSSTCPGSSAIEVYILSYGFGMVSQIAGDVSRASRCSGYLGMAYAGGVGGIGFVWGAHSV